MNSVKEAIVLTFAYFNPGKSLEDAILLLYAEDLADLPSDKVIAAYHTYRRNPKNTQFPLPAKIRELVSPGEFISPEDQAVEIAGRICASVPKFGWCNARDAEKFIGPVGWGVVQRQGGWSYLCENMGRKINPTTFQAQVRDQLKVAVKYGVETVEKTIGALPEVQARAAGELQPAAELIALPTRDKADTEAS